MESQLLRKLGGRFGVLSRRAIGLNYTREQPPSKKWHAVDSTFTIHVYGNTAEETLKLLLRELR